MIGVFKYFVRTYYCELSKSSIFPIFASINFRKFGDNLNILLQIFDLIMYKALNHFQAYPCTRARFYSRWMPAKRVHSQVFRCRWSMHYLGLGGKLFFKACVFIENLLLYLEYCFSSLVTIPTAYI